MLGCPIFTFLLLAQITVVPSGSGSCSVRCLYRDTFRRICKTEKHRVLYIHGAQRTAGLYKSYTPSTQNPDPASTTSPPLNLLIHNYDHGTLSHHHLHLFRRPNCRYTRRMLHRNLTMYYLKRPWRHLQTMRE